MAKLVSRLRFIADGADNAAAIAISDTANFILTLIRVYAPVKTGFLRDSYKRETITPLHIMIGTMVNYSIYQEYGTSRMSARPHVAPAFAQSAEFFKAKLAERIRNLG